MSNGLFSSVVMAPQARWTRKVITHEAALRRKKGSFS
jgi:hypothetical protein